MRRPAWAASPNFARCWAGAERVHTEGLNQVLDGLAEARVIAVDREQVQALPRFFTYSQDALELRDTSNLAALLSEVRAPFPATFLDLDNASLAPSEPNAGTVAAALVVPGERVSFSREIPGVAIGPFLSTADGVPQLVCWVFSDGGDLVTAWVDSDVRDQLEGARDEYGWRHCSSLGVDVAAAVLTWLESVNVDLVEAHVSPRQRKRELSKGRKIALTVQVRPPKSKPVGRNGKANYSHRFEVRGHYMHFPEGTKIGDADPEKLSFVPGRGFVRKVWCPPHVKGPADRPLVPKVRIVE